MCKPLVLIRLYLSRVSVMSAGQVPALFAQTTTNVAWALIAVLSTPSAQIPLVHLHVLAIWVTLVMVSFAWTTTSALPASTIATFKQLVRILRVRLHALVTLAGLVMVLAAQTTTSVF